jgi:hypothetical protein
MLSSQEYHQNDAPGQGHEFLGLSVHQDSPLDDSPWDFRAIGTLTWAIELISLGVTLVVLSLPNPGFDCQTLSSICNCSRDDKVGKGSPVPMLCLA